MDNHDGTYNILASLKRIKLGWKLREIFLPDELESPKSITEL